MLSVFHVQEDLLKISTKILCNFTLISSKKEESMHNGHDRIHP